MRAKEGIDFRDGRSLIKYGERVTEILADLNPVEKDVYIKSIAEETGLKEQSLYDLLTMTKNSKEEPIMKKKEENGTKLYVEPGYLKAEKSLLKLMLDNEYYEHIIKNLKEEDLNLDAHKKIFKLIVNSRNENSKHIETYVESRCDDVESSKEWVKISNLKVLTAEDGEKLIEDFIKQIKTFKLQKRLQELKKEQKILEQKGMIEESLKLAIDLKGLNEELKKQKREI